MSEVATYLKVGTTAIVLAMIEDDAVGDDVVLANPVAAIRHISHDVSMTKTVSLRSGKRATALEIQWLLLEKARKYERNVGLECVGEEVGSDVINRWEQVLSGLERDPTSVAHWVDWIAKKRLVEGYAQRHQIKAGDARLKAIDLQYHDMRAEKCLADRVGLERLIDTDAVHKAMTQPPPSTRAYFRGMCLQRWPDKVVAANWDSMVFEIDHGPLRRVPMMEPLRGTQAHVGQLLDECQSAAELLDRLGA
jgi:Pup amidohydrolase